VGVEHGLFFSLQNLQTVKFVGAGIGSEPYYYGWEATELFVLFFSSVFQILYFLRSVSPLVSVPYEPFHLAVFYNHVSPSLYSE
jgi:hypothetical protein